MTCRLKTKPRFGIISGAGPMAGLNLLKQTIKVYQAHGAWRDQDFPEIHLINFPFSDMLGKQSNFKQVQSELLACLKRLETYCDYMAIACNTLHLFLPKQHNSRLIHLVHLIKAHLPDSSKPLVLASLTAATEDLHGRLLGIDCEYWHPAISQKIIDAILKDKPVNLDWLIELSQQRPVILGCTEYSLALENSPARENLIDPIKLLAQDFYAKAPYIA